ncbi:MAG: lytic murein transglycosylase [Elusimicrobia bacterium]|nr:lytic murein transglycosylase [Elusimicrobiota bacterium]
MRPILLACLLAVPAGAEPFLAELEGLRLGLSQELATAGLFRRASEGLSPAEVRAKVDRSLAGTLPAEFVDAAFAGARVLPGIEDRFRQAPERNGTYEGYRRYFMTEERIAAGARFFAENRGLLETVERRYGVDPGLVASFVGIETFYGRRAGTFGVFNALYTITMKVPSRSDWAARELAEFLKLCRGNGLEVHGLLGSYAGAFGFAQFIPSSFNAYAVDFDGDGRRRHDQWPDVLGSVANYEARHNYEPGGSFDRGSRNWWAIYAYNHSEYYVRVVIELRAAILARQPAS